MLAVLICVPAEIIIREEDNVNMAFKVEGKFYSANALKS